VSGTIRLTDLGSTRRAAIRFLIGEMSARGWRDSGETVLRIVEAAQARPTATRRLARLATARFLASNSVSRRELEIFLNSIAADLTSDPPTPHGRG
jgi:hypothetical protein